MNQIKEKSEFFRILEEEVPKIDDIKYKKQIIFERISLAGLNEMHEYSVVDKRFYDYLEYEAFQSIEDTKKYLINLIEIEKKIEDRNTICWFIKNNNNKIIGTARLLNIDYKRQSVSWGYGLDPRVWGNGYLQEIQLTLLDYIFNRLKLNRLYGTAMFENKQTISTLLAIGMKQEGIHPQAYRDFKGNYRDSWSYGMLLNDYKNLKAIKFEKKQIKNNENYNEEKIVKIINEFFSDYSKIDIDSKFVDLPFWDSLKQMELITFLEKELNMEITLEQIIQLKSIRSIIKFL
jgi:RimJ/RimL family protein N-acetyltransferase/acyl carrier protein